MECPFSKMRQTLRKDYKVKRLAIIESLFRNTRERIREYNCLQQYLKTERMGPNVGHAALNDNG